MKSEELTKQQTDAVLNALNTALEKGPWDQSNFLKIIGKNLREIRDEFANEIESSTQKPESNTYLANRIALRRGQKKVYIALYSSDGANLRSWEQILANIPRQMISRPIYADENDVIAIIKTKEFRVNEAYVSVYIGDNEILEISADKLPIDKLGKPLLSLKNKALNVDNIIFFVHESITYEYTQGRLIKVTSP